MKVLSCLVCLAVVLSCGGLVLSCRVALSCHLMSRDRSVEISFGRLIEVIDWTERNVDRKKRKESVLALYYIS